MFYASCPLRVSLFGGSSDNPFYVEKYGYGSVISFTCDLKTYVTISQDKIGFNKQKGKYQAYTCAHMDWLKLGKLPYHFKTVEDYVENYLG